MEPVARLTLRCPSGHSFDVNKRGYLSLVAPDDRVVGDTAAMLDARDRFLDAGHYEPIADAVADAVPPSALRILDAGCGTGYYLDAVLGGRPHPDALAMDLSPEAVRRAVRRTGAAGLVADTWRPLPIADGAAQAILDVFAPRNLPEFARVLVPDGTLVVAIPTERHLTELRAAGQLIGVQADKRERLVADAAGLFEPASVQRVETVMRLEATDLADLIGMGPSAHHRDAAGRDMTVTASVDVVRLTRV